MSSSASPISQCYFSHVSRFSLRGWTAISITHTKRVSAFSQRTRSLLLSTLWEVPVRFSHSSALSSYPARDAFSLSLPYVCLQYRFPMVSFFPLCRIGRLCPLWLHRYFTSQSPSETQHSWHKKKKTRRHGPKRTQTKSSRTALSVSIVLIGTVPGRCSHCCSRSTPMSSQ